jgi:MFS transporter, SET family, sugar efflux transporter
VSEAAVSDPVSAGPLRLLTPTAALLWSLQYALLQPALAYLLVTGYGVGASEVGWILGVYGAGAFLASMIIPRYAARRTDSLGPVLLAACCSLGLAVVLGLISSLPVAVVMLIVLGGPAAIGSTLLHTHLGRTGAGPALLTRLRALALLAWVVGPPLAMTIIGVYGPRAVVVALVFVAVLNIATTMFMIQLRSDLPADGPAPTRHRGAWARPATSVIMLGFVTLQAGNVAAVSIMSLFVVEDLQLDIVWAGLALGLAAAAGIPALLVIRGLRGRVSSTRLVISGCLAGILYGAGTTLVQGPLMLLVLQLLDAWFIAALSGAGLLLLQQVVGGPESAAGLHDHAARMGAVVAGPVIALSALSSLGYRGVFLGCVVLAMTGLGCVLAVSLVDRPGVSRSPAAERRPSRR